MGEWEVEGDGEEEIDCERAEFGGAMGWDLEHEAANFGAGRERIWEMEERQHAGRVGDSGFGIWG